MTKVVMICDGTDDGRKDITSYYKVTKSNKRYKERMITL